MAFGDPIRILLVEDSPGDVRLTIEALKDGKVRNDLSIVGDGVEALAFLKDGFGFSIKTEHARLRQMQMRKRS